MCTDPETDAVGIADECCEEWELCDSEEAPARTFSPPTPISVAIDGPAGSGKSSVAREVAHRTGFGLLDTGAVYRAITWIMLENCFDLDREEHAEVALRLWKERGDIGLEPGGRVLVYAGADAEDITEQIREKRISEQVSRISRHPRLRAALNEWFREQIAHSKLPGVIAEGRDITTVVLPQAEVRIILTASAQIRAARRAAQMNTADIAATARAISARDERDLKVVDFLHPAEGVDLIDTSDLDFEGSVQAVLARIEAVKPTHETCL